MQVGIIVRFVHILLQQPGETRVRSASLAPLLMERTVGNLPEQTAVKSVAQNFLFLPSKKLLILKSSDRLI